MNAPPPASAFDAQVIAAFGRHLQVRDAAAVVHAARPSGRKLALVCGDFVRCESDPQYAQVQVVACLPRRTALYRSSARGASEPLAANLTLLAVVVALRPQPDWFVVDRYLCAAASAGIAALLVLNKCELERDAAADAALHAEFAAYAAAGYPCLACSARAGSGLEALLARLAGETAVLVGQSGVGKSSLVKVLVPQASAATGELLRDEEGRHTTSASRLYDLPIVPGAAGHAPGHLIDSPGVRDFAPAIDRLEARSLGFVEIERLASGCRFADCLHMREPNCAVSGAVEGGALHARRYESYRRLRRLNEELRAAQGPGRKT
jgi:ribosome biogenesis GTPase / thiamine phosphate phosphatase